MQTYLIKSEPPKIYLIKIKLLLPILHAYIKRNRDKQGLRTGTTNIIPRAIGSQGQHDDRRLIAPEMNGKGNGCFGAVPFFIAPYHYFVAYLAFQQQIAPVALVGQDDGIPRLGSLRNKADASFLRKPDFFVRLHLQLSCLDGEDASCRVGFPILLREMIRSGEVDVAHTDAFHGQQKVRHFILDLDLYVGEGLVGDASAAVRFSCFDGMLHGVGETGNLLRRVKVGYIGQFLVIDTGGHREAKGQEGEVSFHGCKDEMVSISLTMEDQVWMQPEAFFVGRKM